MENDWESIIIKAHSLGASDIFIQPEELSYHILFRIQTNVHRYRVLPKGEGERLIAHLKFISNMDIGERRKPQTGSSTHSLNEKKIDLRISTLPNYRFQESMVIRLLSREEVTHSRGFFPDHWNKLTSLLSKQSGLILFSGPVGSGKSTTVHQLLRERVKRQFAQVITIEDPVEQKNDQFFQIEVNERAGLTYEVILKQCLRHSPDILFVGEVRDEETAKMVIRASLTGHLVLATIHAKDNLGVIHRMEELGATTSQLEQCLLGVISQRLLTCYCPLCDGECHIYCTHLATNTKQLPVYDLIIAMELKELLSGERNRDNSSLNRMLRKVYRNGYITEECFKKYEIL